MGIEYLVTCPGCGIRIGTDCEAMNERKLRRVWRVLEAGEESLRAEAEASTDQRAA